MTAKSHFTFSPKLQVYYFLSGALSLVVTVIGILMLPIWAVIGTWWAKRYYESLRLELTDRSVVVSKGVFFKRELTIPLDKIQDISISEGPLLAKFGLLGLRIETAGQRNAATGKSEADLVGLENAREVRDLILTHRDRLASKEAQGSSDSTTLSLLTDIRDSLQRIEARLGS
ncbi:PH domain-containing protein [Brevundimonas sp.]|uniref:PH domain-containing protein n=1 Tax=Brevundimonas sp. TaxID=1871086 RepID=UPI00289E068B|nr:PH domain-containing protein [Brevundimonas sp.]